MTDPPTEQDDAIYIAVMCPEIDTSYDSAMKQPLLSEEEDDYEQQRKRRKSEHDHVATRDMGTNTDNDNMEANNDLGGVNAAYPSYPCTLALGSVVGFLIQVVSLGAYGVMLMNWGEDALHANKSNADWFLYAVLAMLTQIDLCIYVVIWLAFTCTMTRSGMAIVRKKLFMKSTGSKVAIPKKKQRSIRSSRDAQVQAQATVNRRSVFIMGVYFLVGIVFGAFGAWTMIDVYLDFPIPFLPIVATVAVDLVLCYLMVWCYDLGREETVDDEDHTACC